MSSGFDSSRHQLFRGDFREPLMPLCLPWIASEFSFTQASSRCDEFNNVCQESTLAVRSGSSLEVNYQQSECPFCDGCVAWIAVCPTQAVRMFHEESEALA
ncbi:MAG: hypothetical protein V7677_20155 [Motiliproteus sp.]